MVSHLSLRFTALSFKWNVLNNATYYKNIIVADYSNLNLINCIIQEEYYEKKNCLGFGNLSFSRL